LLTRLKAILEEEVSDIRVSKRLTDSPVCLVAPEDGVDMHMERVLKLHQKYTGTTKPILEINAQHSLIKQIAKIPEAEQNFTDAAYLLLDQARIIQGQPLKDPGAFTKRMSKFLEKGLL